MADLFWPGDERAGDVFSPAAVLGSMIEVEQAWLDALVSAGTAPAAAKADLAGLVAADVERLASAAEASGAPVVPLLEVLRHGLDDEPGTWLHRGLTTQDVMDTALVLQARRTAVALRGHLDRQVVALAALAERHREDPMMGRTLTQHAHPITFGVKAAHWLAGVLDAREDIRSLRFPAQLGGPVGLSLAEGPLAATALALEPAVPWHTVRTPFTRYADALVRCSDAFGHVAADVLVLARTEVSELSEPLAEGRGASSAMPHKQNPVLSVLVRRAALTAPGLAAQLHLAATDSHDERPDGAWHTEWSTLVTLSRRVLIAASQTTELLEGLQVHTETMAARVGNAPDPARTAETIDTVLARVEEEQ